MGVLFILKRLDLYCDFMALGLQKGRKFYAMWFQCILDENQLVLIIQGGQILTDCLNCYRIKTIGFYLLQLKQ